MHKETPAWYCARTKPKHEHIAAANVRKNLKLNVFNPRLRVQRITQRGVARLVEPLFPCYIFIHCVIEERLNEVQHTNGVSSLVRFGHKIPKVEDSIIEELQHYFAAEEPMTIEDCLAPADEVIVADGGFCRDASKSPAGDASHAAGANLARCIGWPHFGRGESGFDSSGKEHGCRSGTDFSSVSSAEDARLG